MRKKKNVIPAVFAVSLIIYLSVMAFVNLASYVQDTSRIDYLTKQIAHVSAENQRLKYEITDASTDAFVERKAREDLMLAKKGETVVYFKFDEPLGGEGNSSAEENKNFFEKTLDKLLHLFQK